MGGISTGVRTSPAHGNPLDQYVLGWCVVVVWWHIVGLSINKPSTRGGWWLLVTSWDMTEAPWCGVVGGVGGLLFVNYIVDASIFERRACALSLWGCGCVVCIFDDYLCCVAYKLLRAHGGCLGIRS